jgi:hypothetical protein
MTSHTINFAATLIMIALIGACGGKPRAGNERDRERERQPRRARDEQPPRERSWRIDRPAPTTAQTERSPLPVPVEPTLVKQGPMPLVYIVESPATVSVTDLTTGQRLAQADVPARTIVRVEARGGVVLGKETASPGPLPADHQYAIHVGTGRGSEIINQQVAPMPQQPQQQQQSPQRRAQ